MFEKISENKWSIRKKGEMKVPVIIYGDDYIIDELRKDYARDWSATRQLINVASLQGIEKAALAMSDVHPGYGFPIGGVGAFDVETGVTTMAGVGFDINCGVRTLTTGLKYSDVKPVIGELMNELFKAVPAGLGSKGDINLSVSQIDELLVQGAGWVVEKSYGITSDLKFTEDNGVVKNALPTAVSLKAKQRQYKQIGTLGSGNHYLEVQRVTEVFDEKSAKIFGLSIDDVIVSIHCGSRGLGHQIGTDYLPFLAKASRKYGLKVFDKELVGAPINSDEGRQYIGAVNAGINCAFANRQAITHLTRGVFEKMFSESSVKVLYGVGHNTAKFEKHDGKKLLVHRKGSTRAFGPGCKEVPLKYRSTGQPVIIGGTMGTHSYILRGTKLGMSETFGSACHGAGRSMSRVQAKKKWDGDVLVKSLAKRGIIVKAHSFKGVAEEAPGAYKNVDSVVNAMHNAGVVSKVVKMVPLGVVKG
ncbi:MAG: RtcB family protein [Nanoarchaeota archaeon]|nr:RtcB family protein [Nanoarchaeota archaeon]